MDTTIIQVPVTKSFRDEMAKIAINMGFSSLQDLIRFNLTQIKNKIITPAMVSTFYSEKLSPKAVAKYDKMSDDIKSGKEKTLKFKTTRDMFKYLNDPNRISP
ncbi:MAG: hypothetical protein WAV41_00885 [Microgenomates group bacterium]